jgi:hypothetical protein
MGPAVVVHRIKVARANDLAILIRHPAKPHAKGLKPQSVKFGAVVHAVMLVAMEGFAHPKAAGQLINGPKAMRVDAGGFVRHQDVGTLAGQVRAV